MRLPNTGSVGRRWSHLLGAAFASVLLWGALATSLHAQGFAPVEYYISPYSHAFQIDPLGFYLGRLSARYEYRLDPLISRYIEVAYQPNLNRVDNGIKTPSKSLAFGERIYLRDNAAIIGLFAGVNGGVAIINSSGFSFRITLEIGFKVPLGADGHFFIEPEGIIDSYILKHDNMRQIYPYLSIPFGYTW